jgi:phosphate transport system substrate-binding protein
MNDDFLHRIRVEPPAGFMARLKARLDRQVPLAPRARPRSLFRALAIGLLFGGSVFAITLLTVNGVPDFARNIIQSQHQTQPADTSNGAATIPAHSNQQMPFATAQHAAAQPGATSTRPPSLAGNSTDSAPKTGAPTARQPIGGGTTTASDLTGNLVTPKALEAYTTVFFLRGRGLATGIHATDTATEALANFCGANTRPNGSTNRKGLHLPTFPMAAATRRITHAEFNTCTRNIGAIAEVEIGLQVVVLARSKLYGAFALTPMEIFLALAEEIPDPTHPDKLIQNPNKMWSDINSTLENEPIEVLGPAPSSPVGTAFREIIFEAGCNALPAITASGQTERRCKTFRKDGAYIEMPDESADTLSKLQSRPNAIGILTYSSLVRNANAFVASPIAGIEPTRQTILAGTYPGSRTLYLYVSQESSSFLTQFLPTAVVNASGYFAETFAILTPRAPELGDTVILPVKLIDLKL